MGARLGLALAAASSLVHVGCNSSCDTDPKNNPPEVYTAGIGDPVNEVYESSPPTSGILPFPGGKQYFLVHHLGFTPTFPIIEVGFDANGDDFAPCAGNTCVVPCVNSEFIWIRNDTCADFLLRVVTNKRSNFQDGTRCSDNVAISVTGAGDASVEAATPTPDSSEAQSAISPDGSEDATDAAPAE